MNCLRMLYQKVENQKKLFFQMIFHCMNLKLY